MNDKPASDRSPDRLSVNPNSPYYNAEILSRDVGIRFKGVEKTNVEEYCISEGWVRVTAGQCQGPPRQSADDQGARPGRAVFPRQGVVKLRQSTLVMPGQKREARLRATMSRHPRLSCCRWQRRGWLGSSPAMTSGKQLHSCPKEPTIRGPANSALPQFSLSKDKIRVLLLEGVNDSAAQLIETAGYSSMTACPGRWRAKRSRKPSRACTCSVSGPVRRSPRMFWRPRTG